MLKAMRISPQSYPVYLQVVNLLGQEPISLQTLDNHFVVVRDARKRIEIYDEKDFRKEFEWVEKPVKDGKPLYKFLEVKKLKIDEGE